MPKGLLFIFFTTVFLTSAEAQNCNCPAEILAIASEVESNLASYQQQVIENKKQTAYQNHKKHAVKLAGKTKNKKECIGIASIYLSFIRDEHLFIRYSDEYLTYRSVRDTLAIRNFYEADEIVSTKNKTKNAVSGNWYFEGTDFEVEILPSKNPYREYAAVITKDNGLFWRRGNVKFEIFRNAKGESGCVYWTANRIPKYYPVKLEKGVLKIGRAFKFYRAKKNTAIQDQAAADAFEFKALSQKTNYLRIKSFDLSYKNVIDSLINRHANTLTGKPNLIIDLRNNGGGGFDAFQSILPYVLDKNNIQEPYSASVWVSPGNYKYYDETKYDDAETKADSLAELKYVTELKACLGKFTPVNFNTISADTIFQQPRNIALLTNQNTASTAEAFVLIARNSKRVKQFGDYTTGALTYGDIRFFEFNNLHIKISLTTKKMKFRENTDIESIGIRPHFILNKTNESDWIIKVLAALEK